MNVPSAAARHGLVVHGSQSAVWSQKTLHTRVASGVLTHVTAQRVSAYTVLLGATRA